MGLYSALQEESSGSAEGGEEPETLEGHEALVHEWEEWEGFESLFEGGTPATPPATLPTTSLQASSIPLFPELQNR